MSLPIPSTNAYGDHTMPMMSPEELGSWDAPLIALAQKSGGDIRLLLRAFFSFLHRRTDFYVVTRPEQDSGNAGLITGDNVHTVPTSMGFRENDAERLLLSSFRQFPLRRMPTRKQWEDRQKEHVQHTQQINRSEKTGGVDTHQQKGQQQMMNTDIKRVTDTADVDAPANVHKLSGGEFINEASTMSVIEGKSTDSTEKSSVDACPNIRRTKKGKQIPVGNGGWTTNYHWTQTLEETSVVVSVPEGTQGKDLKVIIRPSYLYVKLSMNDKPLLEGDIVDKIRVDESTWTIEGRALLLTLGKVQKRWWESVIKGDDCIDASLVDSTRNIGEYDDATQAAIRKVMFDQMQEKILLKASDEGSTTDTMKSAFSPLSLPSGVEYISSDKFGRKEKLKKSEED